MIPFCVYGLTVLQEDLFPELGSFEEKSDKLKTLFSETDIIFFYDQDGKCFVIGKPLSLIQSDETGREFREGVKALIEDKLASTDIDIDYCRVIEEIDYGDDNMIKS